MQSFCQGDILSGLQMECFIHLVKGKSDVYDSDRKRWPGSYHQVLEITKQLHDVLF